MKPIVVIPDQADYDELGRLLTEFLDNCGYGAYRKSPDLVWDMFQNFLDENVDGG